MTFSKQSKTRLFELNFFKPEKFGCQHHLKAVIKGLQSPKSETSQQ
jgi:hypothetical protein